jgi:hypothetical protein
VFGRVVADRALMAHASQAETVVTLPITANQ